MESNSSTQNNADDKLIYIKDKTGVFFLRPFIDKQTKLLSISNASMVAKSDKLIAIVSGGIVSLYDNTSLELVKKLDEYELVVNMHFSASGKLLVIIQKPSVNYNLKVVDLTNCSLKFAFHSTTHPNTTWPQLKFSSDENYIFKQTKAQLEIFKKDEEGKFVSSGVSIAGIINYEISEITTDQLVETALICGRVVVDEKSKKKKSLLTVYRLSDLSKPVKEMNVSICDRMNIKVSPDKKFVLLQSINDDTSDKSYYGESSLYYLDLLYGKFQKISLPEGPIHDFDWTPNGTNFIVCAGYQPSKTHIYNNAAKFLKEITVSKVNTIRISPDSRILCMAGFGNVNGDIEIYKLSDFSLIGKTKLYCGVTLNWSKDSKYLLGAVLSPRVRVDNEYKIFSYNGEDLLEEKFNGEIYECEWNTNNDVEYKEYDIEVSKVYLKKLEEEKAKKLNAKSITNSLNTLSLNSGSNSKGIPGLKKK